MPLVPWQHPGRDLSSLQGDVNRLFSSFFGDQGSMRWAPAMDLVERDDAYELTTDLPGLTRDDVSIEVENNVLTISGERKQEREETRGSYYRAERAYGRFSRSVTLPEGVNPDDIQASFEDGVLRLQVPKPAQRKPHRVQIQANVNGSS